MKKLPLGIEYLDKQIGGVYPGLIILHEMVGAGGKEFAITSLMNNAENDAVSELIYISITRTPDEVLREIKLTFPEARYNGLFKKLKIISLAEVYFKESIVPMRWITDKKLTAAELKAEKDILTQLTQVIETCGENSQIFLESFTDLARLTREKINWNDFIDITKGFRKLCIKRNMVLMGLLTANVLDKAKEEELFDQADGVFIFEWVIEKDSITRWLYFRKFTGVLPIIEKEKIVKFNARIDPASGFVISKLLRVV